MGHFKFEGSHLKRYREIGKGHRGVVYLAQTNQKIPQVSPYLPYVAEKRIEISGIQWQQQVDHLFNERNVLISLMDERNPLICHLIGTCKTDTHISLVLELVPGITLNEGFQTIRRLPLTSFASQLVSVLEYLHSKSIIYRDLKSTNILIVNYDVVYYDSLPDKPATFRYVKSSSNQLKLCDFGLAKVLSPDSEYRTLSMCGTDYSMAPEVRFLAFKDTNKEVPTKYQSRLQRVADPRGYSFEADLWSLGVVVFEMVACFPPFGYRDTTFEIFLKGLLKDFDSQAARHFEKLVKGLLIPDPAHRFTLKHARKFLEGLAKQ